MLTPNHLQSIQELKPFYDKKVFSDLFSWKELLSLLNNRPFMNNNRVHILNKKEESYQWPAGGWMTDWDTYPPSLLQEEIKKYVCYLQDCSRVNKKINMICDDIEKVLSLPVDAHIFFSLKEPETDTSGFAKHNDTQHNVITLVDGKMNIKVWSKEDKIIIDEDMEPGDICFVPKETDHQVTPYTKRLSVSFPALTSEDHFIQDRHWIEI
jgi:mannose-6-phosphate isomerase-like protein (cupin superfamily)